MNMKKKLIITFIIFIFLLISYSIIRKYSYNTFIGQIPGKVPNGFSQTSIIKKTPIEKDWLFAATYINNKNKQIVFHFEPIRNIRCYSEPWKKNLKKFAPINSIKGCSFSLDYMNNNKPTILRWYLWNKDKYTYHIYDKESILTHQEAIDFANSVKHQLFIAKDETKNED